MRRLLMFVAAVIVAASLTASGVDAAKCKVKRKTTRHKIVRKARPARAGAGPARPVVSCPAPSVTCPTPNVTVQPAPLTCPPVFTPTLAITVDECNLYVVRENELLVIGKNDLCVKRRVTLQPIEKERASAAPATTPGAGAAKMSPSTPSPPPDQASATPK